MRTNVTLESRLGKNSVQTSKDEAPTPLSVVGPLFVSSLLFHLSRALSGAWRGVSVFFVLFTLAFTTGWTSPGSLPFIRYFILFSQFILVCFIICKNEIMILWPPWVRVWGWASYWFLPFTVFSLGLPFCFSSYIVHLRCTSEGGSLDVYRTSHSFFVWGSL